MEGALTSKFQPYPRRELRILFRAWVANNRMRLAKMTIVVAILIVVETLVLAFWWQSPVRWYVLGMVHATFIAGLLHTVSTSFFANAQAAIHQLRGAWGEDNTRGEVQRAKRKGYVGGSIDGIELQIGDLDHFVVTRLGGLVAIDSKWRSEPIVNGDTIVRDAERVKMRAEALTRTLLQSERGLHRSRENAVRVQPVIVVWGPAQQELPEHAQFAGIDFVAGRRLLGWFKSLDGDPIDKGCSRQLARATRQVSGVCVGRVDSLQTLIAANTRPIFTFGRSLFVE